jgi:hypothetical protein
MEAALICGSGGLSHSLVQEENGQNCWVEEGVFCPWVKQGRLVLNCGK